MPGIESHPSLEFVKGLYLGDSGSGKTGSLASLVAAGYKLRIFDFDNLLGSLVQQVLRTCPERADLIRYQTFTDKLKGSDTPLVMNGKAMKVLPFLDGTPTAFINAMKQLTRWKDGEEDLGKPGEWGKETIVVIDTLTTMCDAAFRYCQGFNPAAAEVQATYFAAQQMVANVLSLLASEQFRTNVLVLAHIEYDKDQFEITRGFPRAVGSAMRTKIAPYFNCVLQIENQKTIRTKPTGLIDLKNPVAFRVGDKLPIETGLADFFKAVTSAN